MRDMEFRSQPRHRLRGLNRLSLGAFGPRKFIKVAPTTYEAAVVFLPRVPALKTNDLSATFDPVTGDFGKSRFGAALRAGLSAFGAFVKCIGPSVR
jgi:hypothetical protein